MVRQLSVFVENKPGRVYKLSKILSQNGIDLVMLSIADTKEFGILRLITNDIDASYKILKEAGFTLSITELIGVEVSDKPGGLAEVLEIFGEEEISIDYLYSFARTSDKSAVILFRVDNPEVAVNKLADKNIKLTNRVL